jgi:HD-GYP domain-containing protein (c-di-GMP phosphodiesterase class II)
MKSESTAANLKVVACEDNIAKWKAEIRELETRIAEEEKLQKHFTQLATQVSPSQIEAKANEGLRLCGNTTVIQAEVKRLEKESHLLKIKLAQTKELYRAFQRVALNNV